MIQKKINTNPNLEVNCKFKDQNLYLQVVFYIIWQQNKNNTYISNNMHVTQC